LVAHRPKLNRADRFALQATPDDEGEASPVAPLASESPNHVVVVRIRRGLSLFDGPAEEPRRIRIDAESPMRRCVLRAMSIEREELVQRYERRLYRARLETHPPRA